MARYFLLAFYCFDSFASIKVGLVIGGGGRDDKSFNATAYEGAKRAEKELKVHLKVLEASDDSAFEPSLRTFAQRGYDLVIGIGFVQANPIRKVATEMPNVHFLLIDAPVELSNVRSVLFAEHEGSYLVGAIAGLASRSKVVGIIGGMDIPLIRRFELGYRSGAESVGKVKVLTNFVGSTSDAWRNPTKGKELALSQYSQKADIIFAAAGSSGLGVFDAAEELKKLVIGVDANQNWIKPGFVLTSMIKRVDLAVYQAVETKLKGTFQVGVHSMGLSNGGIDYAVDDHNRALLSPEVLKKAEEIKKSIILKTLKVPDYYLQRTSKS